MADDAELELAGEVRAAPPAALFEVDVQVRRRVGIDRRPVDVTTEHGARLLKAFVWADQPRRLERLRRAIEIARRDPPTLFEGNFVDVLPDVLERRDADALTIVYDSASIVYLQDEDEARLRETMARAGVRGGLAWVSYEIPEEGWELYNAFALEAQAWPDGARRRLARLDGHANWLDWLA
jgi:hypothetical protein